MKQLAPAIAEEGQREFDVPGLAAPALVTVNGIILQPADFAFEGERITLVGPLSSGDEVGAIVFA